MELNDFIARFAAEFEETPKDAFTPETEYKTLEEWDSLSALSIIAMVGDSYNKEINGADLRSCKTIEDLFNLINSL